MDEEFYFKYKLSHLLRFESTTKYKIIKICIHVVRDADGF